MPEMERQDSARDVVSARTAAKSRTTTSRLCKWLTESTLAHGVPIGMNAAD